ncbi:hypothetical protein T4D_8683 [Trichinella pseudospiralis]|uniref:Uncharacterized protein n=1 Tax=Trichinella pseudospiralis TaxID=6337 RepID=A0A0V1FU50_TRIPS|nr:hypothetical protein T4D_8683 [Trichinella pseudospiralis]
MHDQLSISGCHQYSVDSGEQLMKAHSIWALSTLRKLRFWVESLFGVVDKPAYVTGIFVEKLDEILFLQQQAEQAKNQTNGHEHSGNELEFALLLTEQHNDGRGDQGYADNQEAAHAEHCTLT